MLSNYLIPFIENKYGGEDDQVIFQQDDALVHSANLTKGWFFNNEVADLDWPAKSPDLNVIENAWNWLVKNEYKDYRQFDYLDDLREDLVDA